MWDWHDRPSVTLVESVQGIAQDSHIVSLWSAVPGDRIMSYRSHREPASTLLFGRALHDPTCSCSH